MILNKISIKTKLFLIFVFLSISIYCFPYFTSMASVVVSSDIVIEYGEVVSTDKKDYLSRQDISFEHNFLKMTPENVIDSIEIDTSSLIYKGENIYPEVGNYSFPLYSTEEELLYGIKINGEERSQINIVVIDTTAPAFTDEITELKTYLNTPLDYSEFFEAMDLSGCEISIDETNVNYEVAGEYTLKVVALDIYYNRNEKEVTLVVKEPTLELNRESASIYTGQSLTLEAEIDGPSKEISYKTSNSSVATVNKEGRITAKSAGTAIITATANGVSAEFKLTVKALRTLFTYEGSFGDSYLVAISNELSYLPSNAYNYFKNNGWTYHLMNGDMNAANFNANISSGMIYGITFWDGSQKVYLSKNRIASALLHELGHVVDCHHGRISSGEFSAIYDAERGNYKGCIPGATNHHVNDLREYFGDSFEAYLKWPSKLKACCPSTYEYMKNLVSNF